MKVNLRKLSSERFGTLYVCADIDETLFVCEILATRQTCWSLAQVTRLVGMSVAAHAQHNGDAMVCEFPDPPSPAQNARDLILAGLRCYQSQMHIGATARFDEIATNVGQHPLPTSSDIDALCAHINGATSQPFVFTAPGWVNTGVWPKDSPDALVRAGDIARAFYALGAQSGIHAMIEWCGVMTEYVHMLAHAAGNGHDVRDIDQHHPDCVVEVPDFMIQYLSEKLGCQLKPFIRANHAEWRAALELWFEPAPK